MGNEKRGRELDDWLVLETLLSHDPILSSKAMKRRHR
jgi:hypothetical protein